ncbi:MAG: hypothetical protein U5N86_04985 [Planctomycetota bacterium]|nr:hypothetical protein [Planctomycetota bacterium]
MSIRHLVLASAMFLVCVMGLSRSAFAAGEDVMVGAEIIYKSWFIDNQDYDDDVSDGVAKSNLEATVKVKNWYTDNVYTRVDIVAETDDSDKESVELKRAYIEMQEFLTEGLTFTVGKFDAKWEIRKTYAVESLEGAFDFDMSFLPEQQTARYEVALQLRNR